MKSKFLLIFLFVFISKINFAQQTELLINPDFNDGTTGWWIQGANVTSNSGELTFNITNPGTNNWDVQMGQGGLTLRKGYKYTLSWRAKRETGSLTFQVQLDHGTYAKIFGTQTVHYNNWNESAIVYENTESDVAGVSVNIMMGGNSAKATFDYIHLKEESLTAEQPIVSQGNGPVSYYGQMQAVGNRIHGSKTNAPMQVKGLSFYWSLWGGEEFWNVDAVNSLVDEWKTEIIRVPMAVEFNDDKTGYKGYLDPTGRDRQIRLVETLVNAAIAKDIYVIIDYHSHDADTHTQNAKDFFEYMAKKYGHYDNVIFEIYNEPIAPDWATIKAYSEAVINTIRAYSDNLIAVGTQNYSLWPDVSSESPIDDPNLAYVLHIYAPYGNENEDLMSRVNKTLNNNKALIVTEWGNIYAWGDKNARTDDASFASSDFWMNVLDEDMITSANWCVLATNMKDAAGPNEACLFNEEFGTVSRTGVGWNDTTRMTPSGKYIYKWLNEQAQNVQWRKEIKVTESPILLSPESNFTNSVTNPSFKWEKTKNALQYNFQIADDFSFNHIVKSISEIVDTAITVTGLLEGQKYYWRVQAKNSAGLSDWSETRNFTTTLSSPTNLKAERTALNELKLQWNDNSSNEDGYVIERKKSSDNNYSTIDTVKNGTPEYYDKTIEQGQTYNYRVAAYTKNSKSDYSNVATIIITGIEDEDIPTEFSLNQNYPNPFNPSTIIKYELPKTCLVVLKIYDILGREITTLINKEQNAGRYEIAFNAKDLSSGIYFYKLQTDGYTSIKKMLLIR